MTEDQLLRAVVDLPVKQRDRWHVLPLHQRFWGKVLIGDGCWEWIAGRNHQGYGQFHDAPRHQVQAHRFAYEWIVGPIPDGLELDHLCSNKPCVRPDHLEPVTALINQRRWYPSRCPQGHTYDTVYRTAKGYVGRRCKTCDAATTARYRAKRGAA